AGGPGRPGVESVGLHRHAGGAEPAQLVGEVADIADLGIVGGDAEAAAELVGGLLPRPHLVHAGHAVDEQPVVSGDVGGAGAEVGAAAGQFRCRAAAAGAQ